MAMEATGKASVAYFSSNLLTLAEYCCYYFTVFEELLRSKNLDSSIPAPIIILIIIYLSTAQMTYYYFSPLILGS